MRRISEEDPEGEETLKGEREEGDRPVVAGVPKPEVEVGRG